MILMFVDAKGNKLFAMFYGSQKVEHIELSTRALGGKMWTFYDEKSESLNFPNPFFEFLISFSFIVICFFRIFFLNNNSIFQPFFLRYQIRNFQNFNYFFCGFWISISICGKALWSQQIFEREKLVGACKAHFILSKA